MLDAVETHRSVSLLQNFGVAAALIVAGVLATWVYLKRSADFSVLELPAITQIAFEPEYPSDTEAETTWIKAAEQAYAAGRILEPPADNAIYYFQQVLAQAPGNEDARAGLARIVEHLRSDAESAVFRGAWETARALVADIQGIDPEDAESRLLQVRFDRYEHVEQLAAQAVVQIAAGRLSRPANDNALATYRQILEIEPDNSGATRGVASIVQRLLGFAQSAALAGEQGKAQGFLETARGIDPAAPGLRETGQLVAQWTRMVTTQRIKEHLETASQALQSGKLAAPDMPNALDLFDSVLKLDAGSDAARQGRRLVLEALLERAWSQIRADQFALAADTIHQAERAGVEARIVGVLRDELDYQTTLVRARDGEFERLHHLSELEIRRREVPAYPRNASGSGWVEVHFTVSQEGEVVAAVVHESSSEVFHATSLRAINHWRFKPFLVAGRPIPVRSAVRFSFQE